MCLHSAVSRGFEIAFEIAFEIVRSQSAGAVFHQVLGQANPGGPTAGPAAAGLSGAEAPVAAGHTRFASRGTAFPRAFRRHAFACGTAGNFREAPPFLALPLPSCQRLIHFACGAAATPAQAATPAAAALGEAPPLPRVSTAFVAKTVSSALRPSRAGHRRPAAGDRGRIRDFGGCNRAERDRGVGGESLAWPPSRRRAPHAETFFGLFWPFFGLLVGRTAGAQGKCIISLPRAAARQAEASAFGRRAAGAKGSASQNSKLK